MRYAFIILVSIFFTNQANSQIYEIGVFAGASNVIGDVGRTNYISPNEAAYGALFKWNRSPRHSFRASLIYTDIGGKDKLSDDNRRKARGYEFNSGLLEISAGMEFTFVEFDLHQAGRQSTPYLYTGVTAANHNNYYFDGEGKYLSEESKSWAFGIPIALGIKTKLTERTILGFEGGARYTFSDNLDGSNPKASFRDQFAFGNTKNNDWYMFIGFTVTYTFARRPCYCDF